MKDLVVGLSALILLVIGLMILVIFVNMLAYGMGWIVGWTMDYFIEFGPVFGITFPQLIGLMSVFSTMIGGTLIGVIQGLGKNVDNKLSNFMKEYRGY